MYNVHVHVHVQCPINSLLIVEVPLIHCACPNSIAKSIHALMVNKLLLLNLIYYFILMISLMILHYTCTCTCTYTCIHVCTLTVYSCITMLIHTNLILIKLYRVFLIIRVSSCKYQGLVDTGMD